MTGAKENETSPHDVPENGLNANDILIAEFEYAKDTASQAMEDRHKMVQFYVISIFIPLLSAIIGLMAFGLQGENNVLSLNLKIVIVCALFVLFLLGVLFFLNIIRLRVAWYHSAKSMNKIKKFYSDNIQDYNLEKDAFIWNYESLKKMKFGKMNSIFFYSAFLVIVIDSLALCSMLVIIKLNFITCLIIFLLVLFVQLLFYINQKFEKA